MKNVQGNGIRAVQRSISQRVDIIEENLARALFGVNQRLQALERRMAGVEEGFQGYIAMEGVDEALNSFINDQRVQRARDQAQAEKTSLEQAIADGYVFPDEKVGEESLIVGRFLNPEGNSEEPGRYQLITPRLGEEYKPLIMGQSVGFKLAVKNGRTFVLDEIYRVDEAKFEELQAAKAAAAAKAAEEAKPAEEPAVPTETGGV